MAHFILLYSGRSLCPAYSQSPSTLTNSTCWAGCCSSPAGWLYFCKWPVCKCTSVPLFLLSLFVSSPDLDHVFSFRPSLQNILAHLSSFCSFFFFFFFSRLILYVVPSVAWGEDGIDELHVVGYVYQELLVCTANFTYIYATSLSTLYSLCLLYNTYTTYWLKYLYKGCTVL